MSHFTVEAFLHDLAYKHGYKERFLESPDEVLDEYPLSDVERTDIKEWNVKTIHQSGVSPMLLLLSYASVNGMENRITYLRKMGMPEDDVLPEHSVPGTYDTDNEQAPDQPALEAH